MDDFTRRYERDIGINGEWKIKRANQILKQFDKRNEVVAFYRVRNADTPYCSVGQEFVLDNGHILVILVNNDFNVVKRTKYAPTCVVGIFKTRTYKMDGNEPFYEYSLCKNAPKTNMQEFIDVKNKHIAWYS